MGIKARFKTFATRPELKELRFTLNMIKKSPLSLIGMGIVLFFALIAIFAPVIAPPLPGRDPYIIPREGFSRTPKPPSENHIFGLAQGGYDIFYGCIWGTRTAFYVGLTVIVCATLIGIVLGSISGYYGGIIDEVLMRITDVFFALPGLILAMAFAVAFGPSLDSVIKALILVWWPTYARLVRSEVLRIKNLEYVEAAKAGGCSDFRVIVRHILPNAIFPILVVASLDTGSVVLEAATLSFLGIGAPYGYADWGQMVSFSRNWIVGLPGNPYAYWYTFVIPGIFIFMFVLGWSLLGDAFRDILDPMIRRR